MKKWLPLIAIVVLAFLGLSSYSEGQATLSVQVLRLLTRDNTWPIANTQTFENNIVIAGANPSSTTNKLYELSNDLYYNGIQITTGGGPAGSHNLLSTTHPDTLAGSVTRGDIIVGNATPAWSELALGASGTVLRSNGTDALWSTDGSALTALNASNLASGTVPLARLSGITNAEIAGGAAIAWSKIDKTGSSLADLTTKSAAALDSGTLADARLSANVSLLGQTIETAEITNATILFADFAANACTANQYVQYSGAIFQCDTLTQADVSGAGTVTSVAQTVPSFLSVSGSPITTSGTLAITLVTQTANTVFAGPSSGVPANPTFRSLVNDDLPLSGAVAGSFTKVTINTRGVVTVGATADLSTADVTGTLTFGKGGTGLAAAADDTTMVSSGSAWVATAVPNCATGLAYATATNLFSCAASAPAHAILSASHSDAAVGTVVRGDLIVGNSTPAWARLAVGAVGQFVGTDGTDTQFRTYADKIWLNAGKCQNVTTVNDWSLPTAAPAVAACVTGTNTQKLVLDFADASDLSAQRELRLPATFTGAIDIDFTWYTSATAGDVVWQVQTICVADGETGDPAFNTASTVTDTAKGTTNQYNIASITGITTTGCAASEVLYIKVRRDSAHASDTLAATARLVGVELTIRRQI